MINLTDWFTGILLPLPSETMESDPFQQVRASNCMVDRQPSRMNHELASLAATLGEGSMRVRSPSFHKLCMRKVIKIVTW